MGKRSISMENRQIGHFEIIRELGRGGKGIVYLARDTRLDRLVALKFLKTEGIDRQKILREAQLASKIRHPGVVTIYDVVDSPEGMFIVMEYVEGESLDAFLKTHRIDFPFALRLAQDLTRVLAAAHRKGLVHGDLKPSNIMLTPEGTVKLLDFGLANLATGSSGHTGIAGTFPYIAPEQIMGSPATEQTDIYALGIILYRLFTGKELFLKENPAATIYAMMHEMPPPPSQFNKKIPTELDAIILRCLEKEAQKRYNTANILLENLTRIQPPETRETIHFSRVSVALIISVLVLIILSTLFIYYKMQNTPLNVSSLASVDLEEPVELFIHTTLPEKSTTDVQIRMYGLLELLKVQLLKIRNLEIRQEPPGATTRSVPGQYYHLSLTIQGKEPDHLVSFKLEDPDRNVLAQSRYPFRQFNDLSWISSKIIEEVIYILLGKRIILNYDTQNLKELLRVYKHLAYGNFYFKEKKYQLALTQLDQALQIDPFLSAAHYYKGLIYSEMKNYQQAIYELNQALPEARKKKLVDWEVEFPSLTNQNVRLRAVMNLETNLPNSDELWFFLEPENTIYLISARKKEIFPIQLPRELKGFTPSSVYQYRNTYIFSAIQRVTQKARTAFMGLFDPQTSRLVSLKKLPGLPQPLPPHSFFYLDKFHQRILQIDLEKELSLTTQSIPFTNVCRLFPSSRSGYYLCVEDTQIYTVHIKKNIIERHPGLGQNEKGLHGYKTVIGDLLLYHSDNQHQLVVYNFVRKKVIRRIPLVSPATDFQFITRRPFLISWRDNEFYAIQNDTFLHMYKIEKGHRLTHLGKIPLSGSAILNRVSFSLVSHFSNVFYDKTNQTFLIFNKTNGQIFRVHSGIKRIRYALSLQHLLFIQTNGMLLVQDFRVGETFSKLQGNFQPIKIFPDRHLILFFERSEGRLVFYNYAKRRPQGFIHLESRGHFVILTNRLFYFSQNKLKSLNLEMVPEKDVARLTDIYYQIARNAYLAGNYQLAHLESQKVLQELNPSHLPSHLIQFNLSLALDDEAQFTITLPRVYNLLEEKDKRKRQLIQTLKQSKLYEWERSVPAGQGKRLFQIYNNHILFANIKSAQPGELWSLHTETGEIAWRFSYRYKFFGTVLPDNRFLFCEAPGFQEKRSYYLMDLNRHIVVDSIPGTRAHRLFPKFYPYQSGQMVVFFQLNPQNPAEILLLNPDRKTIRSLYTTTHYLSQLHIHDGTIVFFSGDSLHEFDIQKGTFHTETVPQSLMFPVKKILWYSPQKLIFMLTNGNVYLWNRISGNFRCIAKAQSTFLPDGFIDLANNAHFFQNGEFTSFPLNGTTQIEKAFFRSDTLYLLEPDRIVLFHDSRMIHQLPLIWSGFDFRVGKGKAYILNADGRLYAVRLNWHFNNVKKRLILSLN